LCLMACCAVGGFVGWMVEHRKVEALERLVASLQKEQRQSAIDKSVSEQMSTIASQQKDIAEERTDEALKEKQRADMAFERSEFERRKAEQAEYNALSEKEKAEWERQRAVEARGKAEQAEQVAKDERNKADTLHYQSLGRSLGAASRQAFSAGQLDMAQLLAFYSLYFTERYGGAVFFPDVFQPLLNASHSMLSWPRHQGQIVSMVQVPDSESQLVSVCDYGSILMHSLEEVNQKTELRTSTLLSDKRYDFRHVYVDKQKTVYAISRSGHLVVISHADKTKTRILPVLEKDHPFFFWLQDEQHLLVIGNHHLAQVDLTKADEKAVTETVPIDFTVKAHGRIGSQLILFDDQHRQHLIKDIHHFETQEVPVPGQVTSYCNNRGTVGYGMEDGAIYLCKQGSRNYQKLLGHESRVLQLKMDNQKCYSAGYDGKVNFWYVQNEKIEPMELIDRQTWIYNIILDKDVEHLWLGDKSGFITQVLLDVNKMKDVIETGLRKKQRDLTEDEWNYYIGKSTPYHPVILTGRKEVQP